jgi:hypothetical protein
MVDAGTISDIRSLRGWPSRRSQVSDATIMSLAGLLSRKLMERYSHTRNKASDKQSGYSTGALGRIGTMGSAEDEEIEHELERVGALCRCGVLLVSGSLPSPRFP